MADPSPSQPEDPRGPSRAAAFQLRRLPKVLWIVFAGTLAALSTWFVVKQLAPPQKVHALPSVHFLGAPLPLNQQATTEALRRLRQHVNGLFSLRLEGQEQRVSFGDLGVELDKARLGQLLRDTVDPTSPFSRWRRRQGIAATARVDLPVPVRVNPERLLPLLRTIKDEHDRQALDARLDLAKREVRASVDGLLVDIDQSALAITQAIERGESVASVAFERVAPRRRTEDLTNVRFDHVLSVFETPYDRAEKAAARSYNLRLAASRLDGTVLLPGEVFDFNQVVGPRDEANGYRVAKVIAEGELVDGIGGGTCQISGTLHGAVVLAGLDIVERYPHTRPSSYIKLGLDATVVYPTINFRFRNPFDTPVVLHQTVKDGKVRAEVLGAEADRAVTLIRRVDSATPYEQIERPEAKLPKGKRVLGQRGVPGFKLRTYRIIRTGPFAERERWLDHYPPTTQVVLVGSGEAKSTHPPEDDPHPEYTADELLVVTLRSEPGGKEPEVTESREAGRFGWAGWTAEAGMPLFQAER